MSNDSTFGVCCAHTLMGEHGAVMGRLPAFGEFCDCVVTGYDKLVHAVFGTRFFYVNFER